MFNAVEIDFLLFLILRGCRSSVTDQPSDSSPEKHSLCEITQQWRERAQGFLEMYSLKPGVIIQADC